MAARIKQLQRQINSGAQDEILRRAAGYKRREKIRNIGFQRELHVYSIYEEVLEYRSRTTNELKKVEYQADTEIQSQI